MLLKNNLIVLCFISIVCKTESENENGMAYIQAPWHKLPEWTAD